MATEKIGIDVEVQNKSKKGLNDVRDDLKGFQKRIKSEKAIVLSTNVAKIDKELKQVKQEIKQAQKRGDFDAEVELRADAERLKQQLTGARRELRNFTRTGQKDVSVLGKLFGGVNDRIKRTTGVLKQAGGALIAFFAIDRLIDFSKKLIGLGSDLEEISSKFNTVFRGVEDEATEIFNNLADTIGRSRLELKEFSSLLGDVLKPLGFTTQESLKLSENITKLAIDVASFNNVSDEQVVRAFTSALTGEREALKTLGIVINETDVKRKAYQLGLQEVGKELTKQQKTLATYQLLLDNTADAQGDAIRTSESFANQLKRLKGTIKDFLAGNGRELADQSSSILKKLNNFVKNYAQNLLKVVGQTFRTLGSLFSETAKGLSELYGLLSSETQKASEEQQSFSYYIAQTFNTITNGIKSIIFTIKTNGKIIANLLTSILLQAKTFGTAFFGSFKISFDSIVDLFSGLADVVGNAVKKAANSAISNIDRFISVINKIPGVDGAGIDFRFNVQDNVSVGFDKIAKNRRDFINKSKKDILNTNDFIYKENNKLVNDIKNSFKSFSTDVAFRNLKIKEDFKKTNSEISKDYDTKFDSVKDGLKDIFDNIANRQVESLKEGTSGTAKEEYKKRLKEEAERHKKYLKEKEKEENEYNKDRLDTLEKGYNEFSDIIDKEIDKSKDAIEEYESQISKLEDSIDGLNKKLQDLEQGRAETLGERNVEINKELERLRNKEEKDVEKINELLAEKRLIEENATKEELEEAKRIAELSPTARFLEEFEQKKKALEEERELKQQQIEDLKEQKEEEGAILDKFTNKKQELDERYKKIRISIEEQITDKVFQETNKQINKLEELRQKAIEATKAMRSAGVNTNIPEGGTSNKTTNNSNVNINVNGSDDPKKVAKEVEKVIIRANKNANKGSL